MSKQLLRSGTAVGALYREAEQAESKPDFIHTNSGSASDTATIKVQQLLKRISPGAELKVI